MNLDKLDFLSLSLEVTHTDFKVAGKRGKVLLQFCFKEAGVIIGRGEKVMVLSGLREFNQQVIDELVNDYDASKQAYVNA